MSNHVTQPKPPEASCYDVISKLNKEFGNFVDLPSKQNSDIKTFFEVTRLLLLKSDLLCKDDKFLLLVSESKQSSHLPTTQLSPKNVISSILEFLLHSIQSLDNNKDDIRNVLKLLVLILSLGPDLAPVDTYFKLPAKDNGANSDTLNRNIYRNSLPYQPEEFLYKLCDDVIQIYEKTSNLIGQEERMELVLQACRFVRGSDPSFLHCHPPITNLLKLSTSTLLSNDVITPNQMSVILRLISDSPSLLMTPGQSPLPPMRTLFSHLQRSHSNLPVCQAMTSCFYRLFIVSDQTLDACLENELVTPLMQEIAFLLHTYGNPDGLEGSDDLIGNLFEVLKCFTSRRDAKIIISGQPDIIQECTRLIQYCSFESIFAVRFLHSLSEFLSPETVANLARTLFNCTKKLEIKPNFADYFNYVTLEFLSIHGMGGSDLPDNRIGSREFVEILSYAILQLSQEKVLEYGLQILKSFVNYKGISDVITAEFISALTRLFLEIVSEDVVGMVRLFTSFFCLRLLDSGNEAMKLVQSSDLVPQVVKLFLSEERCEFLTHYSRILQCAVIGYEKAGVEFDQLKDKELTHKMTGLLTGKNLTIQESTDPDVVKQISSNLISCLWAFSCDTAYVTSVLSHPDTISHLVQVLRASLDNVDVMIADSYEFRGVCHILSNIGLKKETYKLDIAETGIQLETYQLLAQLIEYEPIPWSLLGATLRLTDIITSDEIIMLQLVDYGYLETLTRIATLNPDLNEMVRVVSSLNACAFIGRDLKQQICSVELLEVLADLIKQTRDGRLYCICCGLLTTLSDMLSAARMVSKLDIFSQLLSTPLDEDLVLSSNQVGRWAMNLFDKVALNCVTIDDVTLSPKPQTVELSGLVEDGYFIVHRMMGLIRQGCMNCEERGSTSCTQSDSLSTEEFCFYSGNLSLSQYQTLVNRGWYRRGGERMYRWNLKLQEGCLDWEVRVRVKEFSLKQRKTFQRVMKRIPSNLTVDTVPARFTEEGYCLYNEYNLHKHDKSRVSKQSYVEHVVDTCVPSVRANGVEYGTFHQEYRVAGELIAIGVIDIIPEGVISIYFYYKMRHDVTKLSLGTYSSLREIALAQELSALSDKIQFYYLQGWNGTNRKLSYKADYSPTQFLSCCVSLQWQDEPTLSQTAGAQLCSNRVDKEKWETEFPPLDNREIRVWIDGMLITFQQLLAVAKLSKDILDVVGTSLEQLCYAIGPELTSRLVLVYHTSSDTLSMSD